MTHFDGKLWFLSVVNKGHGISSARFKIYSSNDIKWPLARPWNQVSWTREYSSLAEVDGAIKN